MCSRAQGFLLPGLPKAWPGLPATVLRRVATFGHLMTSQFASGGWTSSMGACFGLASWRTLRKGMLPLCVRRWSGSPAVGCCGTCTGRLSKIKIPFSSSAFGTSLAANFGIISGNWRLWNLLPKPMTSGQAGVPAMRRPVWGRPLHANGLPTLLRNLKFQRHPWARVLKRRRRSLRPCCYSCMTTTSGRPVFLSCTSLADICQPQAQDDMSPRGPKCRTVPATLSAATWPADFFSSSWLRRPGLCRAS